MITFLFLYFTLIFQITIVYSNCPMIEICRCNTSENEVICDGSLGNQSEDSNIPPLAYLPPVKNYYFSNFKEIQTNAFENMTFLANHSITLHFANITTINAEAFSSAMVIPDNSRLRIYIEDPNNKASLTLETHAFNHIKIDRLHFYNIKNFNGQSIFNSHAFGSSLYINELIFEQSNLTGFSSSAREPATVEHLYIRDCPELKQLTNENLPTFLGVTKTLELSNTGLELIDDNTFQGWSFILRELLIKNNPNLQNFSTNIINQFLMDLEKVDLSNNSIVNLNDNADWSPFYHIKHLILTHQKQLDIFIKSDILKDLQFLKTIDLSEGIVSDNDEDLMQNHVADMSNLLLINVSYTNFTENMVIDLLTKLSSSANQYLEISLLGHILNDTNFCSYFKIFQQSPNLLRLELDETHECNCIVDLFFDDEHFGLLLNDSLIEPTCLLNTSRAHCDIQTQLSLSKCSVGNSNSDPNYASDIGSYAFIGVMSGLTVVLIALLALGSSVIYRARKGRRGTIPLMDSVDPSMIIEQPHENPVGNTSSIIIEQQYENSVDNTSSIIIEQQYENWTTDDIEEHLESSF